MYTHNKRKITYQEQYDNHYYNHHHLNYYINDHVCSSLSLLLSSWWSFVIFLFSIVQHNRSSKINMNTQKQTINEEKKRKALFFWFFFFFHAYIYIFVCVCVCLWCYSLCSRDWQVFFIVYVPLLSCKNNILRKKRNRASASPDSNREEHARTSPSMMMVVLLVIVVVRIRLFNCHTVSTMIFCSTRWKELSVYEKERTRTIVTYINWILQVR